MALYYSLVVNPRIEDLHKSNAVLLLIMALYYLVTDCAVLRSIV